DRVSGGTGNDRLFGGAGPDALSGDEGNDDLSGDTEDDSLSGGPGDDSMYESFVRPAEPGDHPTDGDDRYDGGPGTDLVSWASSPFGIDVSLKTGIAQGDGSNKLTSVESIQGSDQRDRIEGSDAAETLAGGDDNDTILAAGGDDELRGESGDDELDGGDGSDTVGFRDAFHKLVVNLAGRASTGEGNDALLDIENVYGGYRKDFIIGDDGPNRIFGGISGEDTLRGLGGDDKLVGGLYTLDRSGHPVYVEDDVLIGGPGDDVLDGAFGSDTADFASSTAGVTADLRARTAVGEGNDKLVSMENLSGSGYDDVLVGDSQPNELVGRSGNDSLQASD
ncbi:MAG: hypothetical protein M3290_13535, partial [Actinomycetota bacterium]|nr:hypothetical protein [Actinomycetota bacterium]